MIEIKEQEEALKQSKKEQQIQIKAQLEQESATKVKELEDALQAKSVQIQEVNSQNGVL